MCISFLASPPIPSGSQSEASAGNISLRERASYRFVPFEEEPLSAEPGGRIALQPGGGERVQFVWEAESLLRRATSHPGTRKRPLTRLALRDFRRTHIVWVNSLAALVGSQVEHTATRWEPAVHVLSAVPRWSSTPVALLLARVQPELPGGCASPERYRGRRT